MEALGLASAIIACIDASYKLINGSHKIYKSAAGATEQNLHRSAITTSLQEATSGLSVKVGADKQLQQLATDCNNLSGELEMLLSECVALSKGKRDAMRAGLKSLRKEKRMVDLSGRLDQYTQQLNLRLLQLLFDQNTATKAEVQKLRTESHALGSANSAKLDAIQDELRQNLLASQAAVVQQPLSSNTQDGDGQDDQRQLPNVPVTQVDAAEITTAVSATDAKDGIDHSSQHESNALVTGEKVLKEGENNEPIVTVQLPELHDQHSDSEHAQSETRSEYVQLLMQQILDLKQLISSMPQENKLLESLSFAEMFRREGDIQDPTGDTYIWLIPEPTHNRDQDYSAGDDGAYNSDVSDSEGPVEWEGSDAEEVVYGDDVDNGENNMDGDDIDHNDLTVSGTEVGAPDMSTYDGPGSTEAIASAHPSGSHDYSYQGQHHTITIQGENGDPSMHDHEGGAEEVQFAEDVLSNGSDSGDFHSVRSEFSDASHAVNSHSARNGSSEYESSSDTSDILWIDSQSYARATLKQFLLSPVSTSLLIVGKAGCGKSTVLKLLAHDETIMDHIQSWAEHKLIVVRVCFWRSSGNIEKTMEGFHRSVLFQVICQWPELRDELFPQTNTADIIRAQHSLRPPGLRDAFGRLIALSSQGRFSLFAFIDGLDEYDGDNTAYDQFAKQLQEWASLPHVKILCTARPYPVFTDVFEARGDVIWFHKLTRSDIAKFATIQFKTLTKDPIRRQGGEQCLSMVWDIVDGAEGVFLWATLVVSQLSNAVIDLDSSPASLRRRLDDSLKLDLRALLSKTLEDAAKSPIDRERSNMLFFLVAKCPDKIRRVLNVSVLSIVDAEVNWFLDADTCNLDNLDLTSEANETPDETRSMVNRLEKRLHQLTRGLLVIRNHGVDFFHRSVQDFLLEQVDERRDQLAKHGTELDLFRRLCLLDIATIDRAAYSDSDSDTDSDSDSDSDLTERYEHELDEVESVLEWLGECAAIGNPAPAPFLVRLGDVLASWYSRQSRGRHAELPVTGGHMWLTWVSLFALTIDLCCFWLYWKQASYVHELLSRQTHIAMVEEFPRATSLLLTACWKGDHGMVAKILSLGRESPKDLIVIHSKSADDSWQVAGTRTIWLLFLSILALGVAPSQSSAQWPPGDSETMQSHDSLVETEPARQRWEHLFKVLELLLDTGADGDALIRFDDHHCSLKNLVDVYKPPNRLQLSLLLQASKSRWSRLWRLPFGRETSPAINNEIYNEVRDLPPIPGDDSHWELNNYMAPRLIVLASGEVWEDGQGARLY